MHCSCTSIKTNRNTTKTNNHNINKTAITVYVLLLAVKKRKLYLRNPHFQIPRQTIWVENKKIQRKSNQSSDNISENEGPNMDAVECVHQEEGVEHNDEHDDVNKYVEVKKHDLKDKEQENLEEDGDLEDCEEKDQDIWEDTHENWEDEDEESEQDYYEENDDDEESEQDYYEENDDCEGNGQKKEQENWEVEEFEEYEEHHYNGLGAESHEHHDETNRDDNCCNEGALENTLSYSSRKDICLTMPGMLQSSKFIYSSILAHAVP